MKKLNILFTNSYDKALEMKEELQGKTLICVYRTVKDEMEYDNIIMIDKWGK